ALIPWELMRDRPMLNLHLLRSRNFALSCALLTSLGIIMLGSVQIIPQLLQEVLGYSAMDAGLVLTAGGALALVAMPIAGRLSGRVDARVLIGFGFFAQAVSLWQMGHLSTQMSFYDAAVVRLVQSFGLPFLFVPINTVAYLGLAPEVNNQASAIMNMLRNLGGTIGISTMQTMLARGAQIHQSRLVEHLNPLNPNYVSAVGHLTHALSGLGSGARGAALGMLYRTMQGQAQMLAYIHVFYFFMVLALCMLPLVLLMRTGRAGGAVAEIAL
ncbi:MAG: MFS transporter, partial [Steroidobacteraceae bacterium]